MFYNSREDKIQLDHTSMNYVVFGKGKKNLVIIPGLNFTGVKGHHIDLAFMHSLYTKEYRVYLFDPIQPMPNTYSIEQMANDLAKALVKLQISSTDVIGISMGGIGTDAAIEASDVVIMNDKISKIYDAINISKKTIKIAKENIIFAITIKILVLILASLGIAQMWMAVFADVGVTIIDTINATRTLGYKKQNK